MEFNALSDAVIKGKIDLAKEETAKAIDSGADPQSILDNGLIAAMDVVGERFAKGAIFVPQMLRSTKTMQECVALLKPHFQAGAAATRGTVVMGTVKGDLHDIGKNLVSMMLEGAGFTVVDLGVDAPPEKFVNAVAEHAPGVVGMSALLSTTMPAMKDTIEALDRAGKRSEVKIIVGGAPVTAQFAESVGADRYAPDAGAAVAEVKNLLKKG